MSSLLKLSSKEDEYKLANVECELHAIVPSVVIKVYLGKWRWQQYQTISRLTSKHMGKVSHKHSKEGSVFLKTIPTRSQVKEYKWFRKI
jgi:hypothetical protein